jgi:flavin-binding protein dodecin
MYAIKNCDVIGYSISGIDEAMKDALEKTENYSNIAVVEILSSLFKDDTCRYQVTLTSLENRHA